MVRRVRDRVDARFGGCGGRGFARNEGSPGEPRARTVGTPAGRATDSPAAQGLEDHSPRSGWKRSRRHVRRKRVVRCAGRGTLWRVGRRRGTAVTGRVRVTGGRETRRTPGSAAGCNMPDGRPVEEAVEAGRNRKGGTCPDAWWRGTEAALRRRGSGHRSERSMEGRTGRRGGSGCSRRAARAGTPSGVARRRRSGRSTVPEVRQEAQWRLPHAGSGRWVRDQHQIIARRAG